MLQCFGPIRLSLFASLILLTAGCSSIERTVGRIPYLGMGRDLERSRAPRTQRPSVRYPWEVWPLEADLSGTPIRREEILQGDALMRKGDRKAALASYMAVKPAALPDNEREALILRIASNRLAIGDTEGALATVSDHFRRRKLGVDDVDGRFSLILGYGYAATGNVDQSLAWFSRAMQLGGGSILSETAKGGIRTVLKTIPDSDVDRVDRTWANDGLVSSLLGRERRRRQQGGTIVAINRVQDFAIVEAAEDEPQPAESEVLSGAGGAPVVGVLLPLAGEYAALGQTTRNGIELALTQDQPHLAVVFKDSGSSSVQASIGAQELLTNDNAAVIVGPLLSEHAAVVGEEARHRGFPILTFSKKDSFETGDTIFRLGPTASSQVRSLLEVTAGTLGMRRYALIYPQDSNGYEFARSFKGEAAARGLSLVYETSFAENDPNALVAIAGEVESHAPEAIFFPDSLVSASRFFSLMSPEALRRTKPIGPASWDNLTELVQSQNVMNGAIFVTPFFTHSSNPTIARFVEVYRAKYGQAPNFLAAQGFDAATLVNAALRQAAEDGVPFSEALRAIEVYDGLTGTMRVESGGEIERTFTVVQFKGGALKDLSSPQWEGTAPGRPQDAISSAREGQAASSRGARAPEEDGTIGSVDRHRSI